MQQDIQEIFNRIEVKKKELKELKSIYKDALDNSFEYKKNADELDVVRQKKKEIEEVTKNDFGEELAKIETLKLDIKTDQDLLNDIALTRMMNGEPVQLIDSYNNPYEPVLNVKFKKMN